MRSFRFFNSLILFAAALSVSIMLRAVLAFTWLFAIPGDIADRVRMLALELAPKLGRDIKARRLAFRADFNPNPTMITGKRLAGA